MELIRSNEVKGSSLMKEKNEQWKKKENIVPFDDFMRKENKN